MHRCEPMETSKQPLLERDRARTDSADTWESCTSDDPASAMRRKSVTAFALSSVYCGIPEVRMFLPQRTRRSSMVTIHHFG